MISVAEAQKIISDVLPPPGTETISWKDASGRILAQEITAPFSMPRFTNSAMDGFAVRAAETVGATRGSPVTLPVTGSVAAGQAAEGNAPPGGAVQIMTGAPLPAGRDSVVMVEDTSGFEDETVEIYRPAKAGQHVRHAGEEVGEGDVLLRPGTRMGPAELGGIIGCGLDRLEVYRQPRAAIIATGNELRTPGSTLEPGQIYNTNLPVISQLVERAGGSITGTQVMPDDVDRLRSELPTVAEGAQILITTGGVSMGRFDYLRPVMLELGVREQFWKVAQKPGMPLFFATWGDKLVFGLPGNPVSAMIIFMEYVWPVLERLQGRSRQPPMQGRLAESFLLDGKKHRFLFGSAWLESGELSVAPTRKLGSHMFTSALGANCILEAPPGEGRLDAGESILLRPLPWTTLASPEL